MHIPLLTTRRDRERGPAAGTSRTFALGSEARDALLALVGSEITRRMLAIRAPGLDPLGLREHTASLARALADALLGGPDPTAPGLRAATERVDHLLRSELELTRDMLPPSLDKLPDELVAPAAGAVREQALEHHGAELMIGRGDAGWIALAAPVTPAQAHVWLLGTLYERVEEWLAADRRALVERVAAGWFMDRWRPARPFPGDEFPRTVREHEFALVERPYVFLGVSPLEYMVEDDLLGDAGPRQRHMAARLLESVPSAWEVESRQGSEAVYRHPVDGTSHTVRDHAPDQEYGTGSVVLGRLIPFGDGTWLRSPGALVLARHELRPGNARRIAEGIASMADEMPPQIALEAAIQATTGAKGLPRQVRADVTPDEAAELLRWLYGELREIGLSREADPTELSAEMREKAAAGNLTVLTTDVDLALGHYMNALFELSKKSRSMRDTLRRRERDAKKRGKGRRRR